MTSTGVLATHITPSSSPPRAPNHLLSNLLTSGGDPPGSPSHVGPWPCSGHVGARDRVRCRRHRITSAVPDFFFYFNVPATGDCSAREILTPPPLSRRATGLPARLLVGCCYGCESPLQQQLLACCCVCSSAFAG